MGLTEETARQARVIRGFVDEAIPGDEFERSISEAAREGRPLRVKYGIDPTNPNIHIGHLVPCRLLRAMQEMGHTAVLIIGDYTAQIGDPTGRNTERPPLSKDEVRGNAALYAEQLFTVIDRDKAELHYQSAWYGSMRLEQLLTLSASFSLAHMMTHETFRLRSEKGARLSLHELLYPVLQAYDSVRVHADIEIGGTDQRFNCLCGRDLQRAHDHRPQVVLTVPLLRGSDGNKMGKSANNHIPLSATAEEAVGRTMAIPDELMEEYIRLATSWSVEEKATMLDALQSGAAHPRAVKLAIAQNIATFLRSTEAAEHAVEEFERVFTLRQEPTDVPLYTTDTPNPSILSLLTACGLAKSKSEARRLIEQGGVRIDGTKVASIAAVVSVEAGATRLIQVGRRRFVRIGTDPADSAGRR